MIFFLVALLFVHGVSEISLCIGGGGEGEQGKAPEQLLGKPS